MSKITKLAAIRETVRVFNDDNIDPCLAKAFAQTVQDAFAVDMSAFLDLVYVGDDFDDDDDDDDDEEDDPNGSDPDGDVGEQIPKEVEDSVRTYLSDLFGTCLQDKPGIVADHITVLAPFKED